MVREERICWAGGPLVVMSAGGGCFADPGGVSEGFDTEQFGSFVFGPASPDAVGFIARGGRGFRHSVIGGRCRRIALAAAIRSLRARFCSLAG